MLLTVREFRDRVFTDLPRLVDDLSDATGRGGDSERRAWQRSLPRLGEALTTSALDGVHVHFARREHHVALEYPLPGASAWCDVVLLGRHGSRPSAVVIELKDWETNADRPGVAEGLVERRGMQELHPSDQVRGYVEYCRRFHSAVLAANAQVHGFVLFTTGLLDLPYVIAPNDRLVSQFPVFTMAQEHLSKRLPAFFARTLTANDPEFATRFACGTFEQDRGFLRQIGQTILDGDVRHFELLDNQRRAFHLCVATAKAAVAAVGAEKRVVIVDGPPGSGKSAVAARLWATLVNERAMPEGNVVLVTTSQSQSSNWTWLLDRVAGTRAGRGIARKATSFSPLDIPRLNALRRACGQHDLYRDAHAWRKHLADLAQRSIGERPGAEDDSCLVSLVDEAHALIHPERAHGVGQYGFVTGLGPQAFHIIRCSRLTVFFLDPQQGFRARENTTIEDIESWASELGARVERVSLHGVQFRCAGSAEYVAWVESVLGGASAELNRVYASAWHRDETAAAPHHCVALSGNIVAFPSLRVQRDMPARAHCVAEATTGYSVMPRSAVRTPMDFRLFDDPFEMEARLRELANRGHTVRLVSTYSRSWKTEGASYPHALPPDALDFHEHVMLRDGRQAIWSRPWNFVPRGDYTGFVLGRPGLPIHDDPLCEVGCTYAVRGFDFDYLGMLWLDDLLWRDGRWVVPLENVHESGIRPLVRKAMPEGPLAPAGPHGVNVLEKVRLAYRILLTRAIRGMFVWVPDARTREHLRDSLTRG